MDWSYRRTRPGWRTRVSQEATLRQAGVKDWCLSRGRHPPRPDLLAPHLQRLVHDWFDLVDDDGSGSLDSRELTAAFQASGVPCSDSSIAEVVALLDINGSGLITRQAFEAFIENEIFSGKSVFEGEYLLPSGQALPFGAMIIALRREKLIRQIMQGGKERLAAVEHATAEMADHAALAQAAAASGAGGVVRWASLISQRSASRGALARTASAASGGAWSGGSLPGAQRLGRQASAGAGLQALAQRANRQQSCSAAWGEALRQLAGQREGGPVAGAAAWPPVQQWSLYQSASVLDAPRSRRALRA